jgi:hypothetical protein
MLLTPKDAASRRPPVFELPKFEFETVVVDLQHIYSGDIHADAEQAQKTIETFIAMRRQKYTAQGKTIISYYPNLHTNIKIVFLTFVFLDTKLVNLIAKQKPFPEKEKT